MLTLSQDIAAKLSRRIVQGVYPIGSKLPTERDLSTEFGVTRHVVREALKRLEAVGLVHIRQGSGIHVENLQLTGGIEMFDVLLTKDDGSIDVQVLREVLEFRAHIVAKIMRLAAERHTEEELAELKRLFLERCAIGDDPAAIAAINERFFRLFAHATHNRVYELLYNTMGRIYIKLNFMLDALIGRAQMERALTRILEAFDDRDGELAELLVTRHLNAILHRFEG